MRKNTFDFLPEERKKMQEEIIYFFQEEREEELGIIGAETILDFFLDVLGETIYNKALDDVKLWLTRNVENMESDYYALYK
ncbi:MAG: DUF2164 domain-containing protein [Eubacterium sp.]|nr:DUF2164 domain-containing protein [Eubacterium sp.]